MGDERWVVTAEAAGGMGEMDVLAIAASRRTQGHTSFSVRCWISRTKMKLSKHDWAESHLLQSSWPPAHDCLHEGFETLQNEILNVQVQR